MGALSGERIRYEGRLRQAENEAAKHRMRMITIRNAIREVIDPMVPVNELDTGRLVRELVPDLFSAQQKLHEAERTVADIRELIG